jgi:hypothetical protein
MKELYLDKHTPNCLLYPNRDNVEMNQFSNYCALNPERFLFFLGTDFYLITYHSCLEYGDKYEFKKDLIEQVIKKTKTFDIYELERGFHITSLRDYKRKTQTLKKYFKQVNFVYQDNANREFAITTQTKHSDVFCNQEEINNNFNIAKEMLIKNEYDWLLGSLSKLYSYNRVFNGTKVEYFKTIEHIYRTINEATKKKKIL